MKILLLYFLAIVNFNCACNDHFDNAITITKEYILVRDTAIKSVTISFIDSITWIKNEPKFYKERASILYNCINLSGVKRTIYLNKPNACKWISVPTSKKYSIGFKDKEQFLFPFDINKDEWFVLRHNKGHTETAFSWDGYKMKSITIKRPTNF